MALLGHLHLHVLALVDAATPFFRAAQVARASRADPKAKKEHRHKDARRPKNEAYIHRAGLASPGGSGAAFFAFALARLDRRLRRSWEAILRSVACNARLKRA